jgi:hypothetical protein
LGPTENQQPENRTESNLKVFRENGQMAVKDGKTETKRDNDPSLRWQRYLFFLWRNAENA